MEDQESSVRDQETRKTMWGTEGPGELCERPSPVGDQETRKTLSADLSDLEFLYLFKSSEI